MKTRLFLTLLFVLPLTMISCSDDDDKLPPIVTQFVEARVDGQSIVYELLTDDGMRLKPTSDIKTDTPDTVYRCVCRYSELEGGMCDVYELKAVFSELPVPLPESMKMHTEPIGVKSVWKAPRYINLSLALRTAGQGEHVFAFVEDSLKISRDGRRTACFTLYHEVSGNDYQSYTQEFYFSMPIYQYIESRFDSVSLFVNTYDGKKQYGFRL